MDEKIIVVRGLGVELGGVRILRSVGFEAAAGDFVAVLGANGTGKSTLLRCLAGLQRTSAGGVDVFGGPPVDEPAFWRDVVLVADEPAWYPGLSVREHLELMRGVHRSTRLEIAEALELFGLTGHANLAPLSLSTGLRQRLFLAMGLVRPSRLLLLDEPERGLDPLFRGRLASILDGYTAEGGTVVMATHDLDLARGARRVTLEAA
ncbi:ABC transporter ATP-binding protein [Actinomadura sp. B10D3]|uniref:ABC transporter ATP-binding protein n=1 Tax=Actinomadura sp. B10D3 TaxID=3153557 RepID=UPI00325DF668